MPTYRKLHTKILDSYDFAEMPDDFTRVFWMLLTVVVDSEGRAIDNPAWLRSRMFPLRDNVSNEQIEGAMSWLAHRGMVVRYEVAGRKYFYVVNFKKYQTGTEREAKSTLPAPDNSLMSDSRVSHEEDESSSLPSVSVNESVNESAIDSVKGQVEEILPPRPEVFTVYEQEIGMLTPNIAAEIVQAEKDYPPGWVADALCEAARNGKRTWNYANGILRNWFVEGRQPPKAKPTEKPKRYDGPITLPGYMEANAS